ncbi:MAG: hypothetical protein JJV98_01470 [Desulfosarcina sp.]|nr:hypothetical protein [Desulfobacterales bacterium]
MKKTATVLSNDPARPRLGLTMSGHVDTFAQIKPQHVLIRGYAGEPIRRQLTVVPSKEHPFRITRVKAKLGTNIKIAWKEEDTARGKTYVIEVENTKAEKGRYYDTLYLFTDSPLKPKIPVQVRGSIAAKPANPTKAP